jgi:hypothetical protein
MTDIAYRCHNCGSVHEVESIRQNLILDLRAAASYQLSGRSILRDLARSLWPRAAMSSAPELRSSAGAGKVRAPAHRPVASRAATGGSDVRAPVIRL